MSTTDLIWSGTDFPYFCLLDTERTEFFKKIITKSVKQGDTVVDIGSGSGILALFAASAGAKKVYAVEIDHILAEALKQTAKLNGYENVIEVVEHDALSVDLPKNVDVVISELIETGLLDELQVPVMNHLIDSGVITDKTKVIPDGYITYIEPIYSDNLYYGFQIVAPKHQWPLFNHEGTGWHEVNIETRGPKQVIQEIDLTKKNATSVDKQIELKFNDQSSNLNGFRMSGEIIFDGGRHKLGGTNALNGDKVFIIGLTDTNSVSSLKITYELGGGLQTLKIKPGGV